MDNLSINGQGNLNTPGLGQFWQNNWEINNQKIPSSSSSSGGGGFPGTSFSGAELSNFNETAGRYVRSSSGGLDFRPGKTLYISFELTGAAGANNELIVGYFTGAYTSGKGWVIERGGASSIIYLTLWNGAGYVPLATSVRLGVHQMAIRWSNATGHVFVSMDGSAETDLGALATPNSDGTCVVGLGSPVAAGNVYADSLEQGSVGCVGLIASELSAANLAAASNSMNGTTPLNRFTLPSQFSSPVVDFNAYRDWDGSSGTFTTLGSSPITFAVTGAITKVDTSEVYYATSADMYHDNGLNLSETYAVRHNSFARIQFTTSLRRLAIHQTSTIQATYSNTYSSIGVFNGDTHAVNSISTVPNASQVIDSTMPAGSSKTINLVEGCQAKSGTDILGTFMSGIRLPTDAVIVAPTAPADRVVFIGDSLMNSFTVTDSQADGPIAVLRGLTDYGVTLLGWGSATAYEFMQSGTRAAWVASLAAMLNGTNSNTLIIQVQTNDYGLNAQSAANYATNLGAFLDDVETEVPGLQVKVIGATSRIAPATEAANGFGDDLTDYRVAGASVTSGRTWVRYINNQYAVSDANHEADGIHWTTAGAAVVANGFFGMLDFVLSDISNLGLDLDSSVGITLNGSDVAQWDDQSGNNNDAAQGTAARQPVYNASGGPNSLPSIDFTYTERHLLTCTTSLLANLSGYSFFIIVKRPNTALNTIAFSGDLANCTEQLAADISYTYASGATYASYASTDTNWLARSIIYDGGGATNADKQKTYENTAQQSLTFFGTVGSTTSVGAAFFFIGDYYTDGSTWDFEGSIAKIVIYTKTVSANEKARVDSYLANRYSVNA